MDLDHLVPDKGALLARHEFFRGVSGEVMRKLTAHARLIGYPVGATSRLRINGLRTARRFRVWLPTRRRDRSRRVRLNGTPIALRHSRCSKRLSLVMPRFFNS